MISYKKPHSESNRQGETIREADFKSFSFRSNTKKAADKERQLETHIPTDFSLEALIRQQQTRRDNWRSTLLLISYQSLIKKVMFKEWQPKTRNQIHFLVDATIRKQQTRKDNWRNIVLLICY